MRRLWVALLVLVAVSAACAPSSTGAPGRTARILTGAPASLDPAVEGDATSAAISAQLFESLTTFDSDLRLQPALAESWAFDPGGRRVTFRLRPGLTFSDGSPLRPSDVVRSWLRLIDPAAPSPLASLALDITGADDYLRGRSTDPASVGLHADDGANTLTVDLATPAQDFPDIIAGPTFGVVPPRVGTDPAALAPGASFVASGGYTLTAESDTDLTLTANPNYWAGPPAISGLDLVEDIGGPREVEAFESNELDYVGITNGDASWIAYDQTLGPQLREVTSLTTEYYGFDTTRPPFDDVRVRQAFAAAVDWRRLAGLAGAYGAAVPANSMVPPGIPGRSDADFVPPYDPAAARKLLAQAGYPGGVGFPATTLMTGGGPFDEAVVDDVKRELGISLTFELSGDGYFDRLATDPPQMWALGWVADYPGRNDFLGVLLGTGALANYGKWSSKPFDAAIAEARQAADPAVASRSFDQAEAIVRNEVPVIPVLYRQEWALSRPDLLGATQNGMGILRMAGLAWAD
jgi:ABC-type transport system substrate-binding protein